MTNNTPSSHAAAAISQDYFDELCIENYEVFEEENYDSAVEETVVQLKGTNLQHITKTYPQQGCTIRQTISAFTSALSSLKEAKTSYVEPVETLAEILGKSDKDLLFHHLFVVENGFKVLGDAFDHIIQQQQQTHESENNLVVDAILEILDQFPLSTNKQFQVSFQAAIPLSILSAWHECFHSSSCSIERKRLLLSITYKSIVRCEANKVLWMKQKKDHSLSDTLVNFLSEEPPSLADEHYKEARHVTCRIITVLCTFDDFTNDSSDQHHYVQMLSRARAVAVLEDILQQQPPHSTVVNALRAMAIQDEIVRSMGSVVSTAKHLFQNTPHDVELSTALLGLFRNVSANDDFKKQLGADVALLEALQNVMLLHHSDAMLQEHAVAWIAALALRQPENAYRLGSANSIVSLVVSAMVNFPARASLQRQGALAIRNMVSRLTDPVLKSSIGSEAEDVLRNVAAKHLNCQDEVYAALRDLGLEVTSVHVERNGDSVQIRKGPSMFGEGLQSNFRAEYDD